jgi:hypothetical protein
VFVNVFIYLHGSFNRGVRRILCFGREDGNPAAFVVAATGALFARVSFFLEAGSDDATSGGCGATVVATAGSVFSAMTAFGGLFRSILAPAT